MGRHPVVVLGCTLIVQGVIMENIPEAGFHWRAEADGTILYRANENTHTYVISRPHPACAAMRESPREPALPCDMARIVGTRATRGNPGPPRCGPG